MIKLAAFVTPVLLASTPAPTIPQSTTYGQLVGVVRDPQGGVLPGASVTMYGDEVMGERSVVTELDGRYHFRALGPGEYNLRFEMPGFASLARQAIVLTTGTTLTVDATLTPAGVNEVITVSGESPTVDVKTTRVGGTFDVTALQDIPSATDVWAVLAQSPGIRMRGYDVGGSHKAEQTAYESFGIRGQNRIVSDGVDSTHSVGLTGSYYDYYSVEEFQVSAAGGDVEMTGPGASVVMTIKSGGNTLSGLFHIDYEGAGMVSNNIDDELAERGFTGNPNLLFWEAHADLGGPIVRDKVWFFGAYNHFELDKAISGIPSDVATSLGLFDNFVAKLTFELGEADRFIGYSQWSHKESPSRGLSVTRPAESTTDLKGWGWVHKAEWQRIWSGRLFTNFQVKHWGLRGDNTPNTAPVSGNEPRIDTATGQRSGSSGIEFTGRKFKPQVSVQGNYYVPSKSGSHDFKFGLDFQNDGTFLEQNSFPIQYRDNSNLGRPHDVDEISLQNFPFNSDFWNTHFDFYAQDIWTPTDRLTLTFGARFMRQHLSYSDTLAEPELDEVFPSNPVPGRSVLTWFNVAPRLGATFDLTGDGRTVLKGHYGRYYFNLADRLEVVNPTGLQIRQFQFLDQNKNGVYDGTQELGRLIFQISDGHGAEYNEDLRPTFADEYSVSLEHELAPNMSARISWVRKAMRNEYGLWNPAQQIPLTQAGIPCGDPVFPCPLDPFTREPLNVARVPDEAAFAQEPIIDTFPGADYDYDTLQFAFSRRFNKRFFLQGNFDYQWRDEFRSAIFDSLSPLVADALLVGSEQYGFWRNHSLDVAFRQPNTSWQGKILGRYVFPMRFAVSGNLRHQSGWPWAPIHRIPIPGSGTQAIFLEDIDNNRSQNVTIVDLRFEQSFSLGIRHRLTAMVDVYNLLNANPETNFVLRTGRRFRTIIAALDPRAVKIGLRWQF